MSAVHQIAQSGFDVANDLYDRSVLACHFPFNEPQPSSQAPALRISRMLFPPSVA
jgi:hypothetical protein